MEGLLDRTSPRRGSLTSLHRQSSGSSSGHNNPKFAQTSSHHQSLTNNSTTNTSGSSLLASQCPDLDRYTRYFIIKAVQIIVQSRVCGNKELRSECKPNGNDWFNINLTDVPEISERTKAAIDQDGVSMKSNWRVCCEISLKTGDGTRVVLEQWIITNRSITITTPPNSVVGSPRTNSPKSSGNNVKYLQYSPSSNTNTTASTTTSTSNNGNNGSFDSQTQQQSQNSNPATASIYTIYNRMTLLLKTLMTTAHIVPAYRLASKISHPSVICYRVYTVASSSSCQNLAASGSSSNSPVKNADMSLLGTNRSVDTLPKGCSGTSIDDIDQHFGPIMKLGSIKTGANELSVCYRTDINSSNHLLASPKSRHDHLQTRWSQGRMMVGGALQDEDYLMAAKQLLCGYGNRVNIDQRRNSTENLDSLDQPLLPAFATQVASTPPKSSTTSNCNGKNNNSTNNNNDNNSDDRYGELIESAFDCLLNRNDYDDERENRDLITAAATTTLASTIHRDGCERSASIQVPKPNKGDSLSSRRGPRSERSCSINQPSSGSTPKSISDSFVFLDINPPFASEEQNDINSFFHGPSPSFSNGFDSLRDVDELTNQLATIEANASQIDSFVDNICAYEGEEDEEEENHRRGGGEQGGGYDVDCEDNNNRI